MGKCIKCGTNFVGTAENPPPDGLCRYCEMDLLKAERVRLVDALAAIKQEALTCTNGPKGLAHIVRLCIDAMRPKTRGQPSDAIGDMDRADDADRSHPRL